MEERKTKELTTEEVNVYIKDCGDIRDTWIIIGKRLLGGQLHKYNEDSIVEKRLKE